MKKFAHGMVSQVKYLNQAKFLDVKQEDTCYFQRTQEI